VLFRSLLKDIVSARDLLGNHPGYPQKSDLETTINETIAILVLDDLEAMGAGKAVLLAAIQNLANYGDQQIALADDKKKEEAERQLAAAIEAEAKRKAEEEKQEAEKARLAEEQSKKASTNLATLSLEPMDKVFAVTEITNIRAAPKVLSDRVGRVDAGQSLTILAKVSGEHWYLVETDQGQRGFVFADVITSASGEKKAATKVKNPAIPDIDFGKYYALVIGNNAYRELPKLRSAINDARAVGALLETQYGFEVELLTNATRSDIYGSLASMRRKVGGNENLLIYYAGHGWLDKEADEGYWMPVDAEEDNPSNWLSSANLISEIRRSKAKHILVVADSCFSGTLTRGLTIKTRTPDYLERIVDKKARTALTSGGLEPVMDSGGESNHSVFASAFLGVLKDNDAVLDGHQLFTLVRKKVIMGSEQTPGYGDIRRSGHDGGDFLFVRQ
ncbi:MAG: caspase family protein, partial [Arenicellales bacterium]